MPFGSPKYTKLEMCCILIFARVKHIWTGLWAQPIIKTCLA